MSASLCDLNMNTAELILTFDGSIRKDSAKLDQISLRAEATEAASSSVTATGGAAAQPAAKVVSSSGPNQKKIEYLSEELMCAAPTRLCRNAAPRSPRASTNPASCRETPGPQLRNSRRIRALSPRPHVAVCVAWAHTTITPSL